MKRVFSELPDWVFHVDEISAGVYEVTGKDSRGHITSAKGSDLDELVRVCLIEVNKYYSKKRK